MKHDALRDFCDLILCGHGTDPDDSFGNIASEDRQPVRPQYYFISSDDGAPDLEDFFGLLRISRRCGDLILLSIRKNFRMMTVSWNGWRSFLCN